MTDIITEEELADWEDRINDNGPLPSWIYAPPNGALNTIIDRLIAEVRRLREEKPQLIKMKETARRLLLELNDWSIEVARLDWGNTNTTIIKEWVEQLREQI